MISWKSRDLMITKASVLQCQKRFSKTHLLKGYLSVKLGEALLVRKFDFFSVSASSSLASCFPNSVTLAVVDIVTCNWNIAIISKRAELVTYRYILNQNLGITARTREKGIEKDISF